jgi:glycine/D-amino acid oxidase-like deaminating enzyme
MGDASAPIQLATGSSPAPATLPSEHPTPSFWQTSYPNKLSQHRSTEDLPAQTDIVIIGTGISGTFAADELVNHLIDSAHSKPNKQSLRILVLEARTLCSGATGRNGGHLQPVVHGTPAGILEFEMANFHHVAGLIRARNISCDFRRLEGCLGFWNQTYFDEAKQALALMATEAKQLVHVVEDTEALQKLGLAEGVKGAIVQKVAGSLSPYKLCVSMWEDLLTRSQRAGQEEQQQQFQVNLQTRTAVTSLDRSNDGRGSPWVVTTARGAVRAKSVIVATNGYTSHLLPQFTRLIRPMQAQMSALIPPPSAADTSQNNQSTLIPMSYGFEGIGSMDRVMSDYLVQSPYHAKSTMEPGGNTVRHGGELMYGGGRHLALHHGENTSDDSFVDARVESYLRTLPERLDIPSLTRSTQSQDESEPPSSTENEASTKTLDIVASWTGIIGHSLDGHPWVGAMNEVVDSPGLFLCAGYSGHGMPNAPLCGRHVARQALASLQDGITEKARQQQTEDETMVTAKERWTLPDEYLISRKRMERALQTAA